MHLSKSDFKVARTCGTKLYYRKLRYPSAQDDNPYLEFLADGGYMVEAIAKLLFPDGREIRFDDNVAAIAETSVALQDENVTLFEATLQHGQLLARVDVLEKRGNHFRLIEVKAKSFHSLEDVPSPFRGRRAGILAKWIPYLEDVTFQVHVLKSLLPAATVTPFLCLVDKAATCGAETIFDKFEFLPRDVAGGAFSRPEISFVGDVDALRQGAVVGLLDVSGEVAELLPEVVVAAEAFSRTLALDVPERIPPRLGTHCKKCEYRTSTEPSGFRECWGNMANPSPHLLDLYRVDSLGRNGEVAERLIAEGRAALLDVPRDELRGAYGERQAIQLEWTERDGEFIDEELRRILNDLAYPIHFIDFEASRLAVPYHPGMRPYEQVAFQWSCHTLATPDGELIHSEWINVEDAYPNFEFARSLMGSVGAPGTVFVWSPFERTTLREIRDQITTYGNDEAELAGWLEMIVAEGGPLVDMLALAKHHYFHPRMKGSLSIKHVLPAVWFESEALRAHPWFLAYLREQEGQVLEPYKTLDPLPFGEEGDEEVLEAVREGTGAMRTYQEMMYGLRKSDPGFREAHRQLLLNYCKLDTAAMVMIWMRWIGRV